MRTARVKICGLTRKADVADAVEAGAWAVGFVAWPGSVRAVTPAQMRELVADVPPGVKRVGVVVDVSVEDAARLRDESAITTLQLHGHEDVGPFLELGLEIIKAVSLETDVDLARAAALPPEVMVMVDAHDPIRRGGTGRRADWSRAATLAARRPVILAGGLRPDNVRQAMEQVGPWGLDVSSGVESSPGVKIRERIRTFLRLVHQEDM